MEIQQKMRTLKKPEMENFELKGNVDLEKSLRKVLKAISLLITKLLKYTYMYLSRDVS